MSLEVIVTSGGTISKIDDVRHVGNFSKGTTGAKIAEAFARAGATVHYVHSESAVLPFLRSMRMNPELSLEEELQRLSNMHAEWDRFGYRVQFHPFTTYESYATTVQTLVQDGSSQVIVLAAAVSDYGAKKQDGKISSDHEKLTVELERLPKVISLVKQWNPRIFQVGFKLLSGVGIEELVDTAYRHGITNHNDLTVANTLGDQPATVLITPEKGLEAVSRSELPERLVQRVKERYSTRHYRTVLHVDQDFAKRELKEFQDNVRQLYALNLFEPYYEGASCHFGFLAMRAGTGFYITARGSDKERIPIEDIVYVEALEHPRLKIHEDSQGKKASLNANVAAEIFITRPEVSMILHSHIFPGFENVTTTDYAPGTQEDAREVLQHLQHGESAVEMHNHGIIVLGSSVEDIIAKIGENHVYSAHPEIYDALYHRFRESPEFFQLCQNMVRPEERILDVGAGTGLVSRHLVSLGYKHVDLADINPTMLNIARKRLGQNHEYIVAPMQQLGMQGAYDAIVVRQAINYALGQEELAKTLSSFMEALAPGGRLIFNAPHFQPRAQYPERAERYTDQGTEIVVHEMNLLEGRVLTHTQRCTFFSPESIKKAYDLNRFWMYTPQEFESALHEAGFRDVFFYGKGLEPLSAASKTLYAVASKDKSFKG